MERYLPDLSCVPMVAPTQYVAVKFRFWFKEVFISFVVSGNEGGNPVHRANVVTLHGEQVLVEDYEELPGTLPKEEVSAVAGDINVVYLPLLAARWSQDQYVRPPWCREELVGNCAPPVPEEAPVEYVDVNDPHRDVRRER